MAHEGLKFGNGGAVVDLGDGVGVVKRWTFPPGGGETPAAASQLVTRFWMALNLDLSTRRAQSVATYLIDNGIDASRLLGTGFGENEPVAPNDTDDNKLLNRRVEFTAQADFT